MRNLPAKKRVIRSFVRREGRLTAGQQRALESLWPHYGLEADTPLNQVASDKDIVLEIGFGMGDSLAHMAAANPEGLFVGIEVHRPGVGHLLKLIQEQNLDNIRIYCTDAVDVLTHCIQDNCLQKVQIFFPDPWHKKRHHKRRLIQPAFLRLLATKLKPGGVLHIATDWQNYAEHCVEALDQVSAFQNTSSTPPYSPRPDFRPMTKFEQRGQRLGHGVWDLIYLNSPSSV